MKLNTHRTHTTSRSESTPVLISDLESRTFFSASLVAATTPAAPTALHASDSASHVQLEWKDDSSNESVINAAGVSSLASPLAARTTVTPANTPAPNPMPGGDAPAVLISVLDGAVDPDHAVHVNGIGSNIKTGNLLTAKFQWDFGDPNSKYNKLVGWSAAHQYAAPGEYTIKLTVTDESGKTAVSRKTIIVAASSRKVIYVSNDGSNSNSGSESSPLKSFSKAMSVMKDNTEVLFRRGDKVDVPRGSIIEKKNVVIGSYGHGAKPVLSYSGAKNYASIIATGRKSMDVTIKNVTFDSIHNKNMEKTGMPDAIRAGGENLSVMGVTFLNIGYGVNNNAKPRGVLVQGCDAPDVRGLRSYLSYVQGSDLVFLGNSVSNVTREHCIRVDGADRVLIAHNDLTNQDRRPMGDRLDTAKQTITVHHGNYAYVYGNATHGGRVEIGPLGEADGLKPTNIMNRLKWVRVESNDFYFGQYNRLEIDHGTQHVMVNNNKIKVVSGSGISIQAAGKYTKWKGYGERRVEDAIIAGDNLITGAEKNVAVGRGSVRIQVLSSGSPVYGGAI